MTEHFTLKYDGPALAEHRMPVTELAPALIAMSELFMVAHRIASDGASLPPSLDARANSEGSFAVELVLSPNEIVDLLNSNRAVAGATIVTLLAPVVGALRWLRNRRRYGRATEQVSAVESGMLRVTWNADGSTDVFTTTAAQSLVESMDFRRTAAAATAPLRQDAGIDTVEIRPTLESADTPPVLLDRDDAVALDQPSQDEDERVIYDITRPVALRPVKAALQSGFKWFVSDGSAKFWVTIHDLNFLQRVESSEESFSAGDILRCQMRERQIQDRNGDLKMERTVLEVMEHRKLPPPDQLAYEDGSLE